MLTVTKKAAALLQEVKEATGAPDDAGIRIRTDVRSGETEQMAIALAIVDEPEPDDEEFEQEGLRIFVEDTLVEPLHGHTLDVRDADGGPKLVWR